MSLKEQIVESLNGIGFDLSLNDDDDIDLRDYIQDSIMFISTIVKLEEDLQIEIPDKMLIFDNFASLNSFCLDLETSLEKDGNMQRIPSSINE